MLVGLVTTTLGLGIGLRAAEARTTLGNSFWSHKEKDASQSSCDGTCLAMVEADNAGTKVGQLIVPNMTWVHDDNVKASTDNTGSVLMNILSHRVILSVESRGGFSFGLCAKRKFNHVVHMDLLSE